MLALHRGRTALTFACLLATAALGGAAAHAPDADASFGQLKSYGSSGTGPGQFDQLQGIAYRPTTGKLYVSDQFTDDNTGDPDYRIQRIDATTGAPDSAPLWLDANYLNGWQNGLFYGTELAVDPRAGQSHLYALLHGPSSDSGGGKVIELDPDATTTATPKTTFPVTSGVGQLNFPVGLAISPADGKIFVGDATTTADDAPPIVRTFAAATGHAAGATIALKDADVAPTATTTGILHQEVRAIAARADGTIAVLAQAVQTVLQGGTAVPDPANAQPFGVVDVYSPALAHTVAIRLPKSAAAVAFAADGDVAVPDIALPGSVAIYDPASATPDTPVRRFGGPSNADSPSACTFWDAPVNLTSVGADLFAADSQSNGGGHGARARVVRFGDGGTGCGFQVTDAKIDVSGEPIMKNAPVTFTGSAVDGGGGTLPDSAYTWTIDGVDQPDHAHTLTRQFTTTGDKTIVLKVTNGDSTATKTLTVHVSSAPPVAAFTVTGDGGAAPASITLDASGSSDPDGTIAEYRWDVNGDGANDVNGKSVTVSYPAAGTYSVRLIVVDGDGDSTTVRKTVTVAAPVVNNPPVQDPPKNDPPVITPPIVTPPLGNNNNNNNNGGLGGASVKPGKATISLGGALTPDAKHRVKVKVGCPSGTSGCSGTLTIVTVAKGKKKAVTLATASYRATAGGSTTVTLTLSTKALSALKKLKSSAIVATAKSSGAAATTAKGTIKAPKAKH